MKNILFFGDSLTAGYGLKNPNDFSVPGRIQQKIKEAELNYAVINAGLSGDTSGGGLARLDYWLGREIAVFVLELGINDIMRGIAHHVTVNNLTKIIERVKMKYPECKLAMMGMEIPAFIPGNRPAGFRSIFSTLAAKYDMALLPFFLEGVAGQRRLNLSDGLHPNEDGYSIIANNVWPVLLPLLEPEI